MTDFHAWLRDATGGASMRAIAREVGVHHTLAERHLNQQRPPVAETVIAVARAYKASPLDGLIAAGHLTEQEVATAALEVALRRATDRQLAIAMLERAENSNRATANQIADDWEARGDLKLVAKEDPHNEDLGVDPEEGA